MSDHHIQLGMLIIQTAAFAGLVVYCIETWKMRMAAQAQVTVSQKVIKAAMDQVEGLSKPCLTLAADLRDPAEAIMAIGVVGSTVALFNEGNFIVQNIGNGPALNINYQFIPTGEYAHNFPLRAVRYVQNVLTGQRVRMIEPKNAYNGQYEVVFRYTSIGGRDYESKIGMSSYVLTHFGFREVMA